MENKVPDRIPPKPGIAEAIHPEIGNGVSWETNEHQFLLRSPDPTKELDNQLLGIDPDLINSGDREKSEALAIEVDQVFPKLNAPQELDVLKEGLPSDQVESPVQDEEVTPAIHKKEKEKTHRRKKIKAQEPEDEVGPEFPAHEVAAEEQPKAPKAGKLVRKAAKSVRKQEEDEKKAIAQELTLTESTLSPFTQWLKGLKGSDYVHPYDDDFAFVQGTGPAKEGISETFAELLASQGYKDQAVEMYLKLMEKYPEKSGFFAAKIEALQ